MVKIEFKITDLNKQKITEAIESWFLLNDNYFEYCVEFYASESDDEDNLTWKDDVYTCVHKVAEKECVKGITLEYIVLVDQWMIKLCLLGFVDDIKLWYHLQKDATDIFNQIIKWRFNG